MRIYLTGASGFVVSNLAHVFACEHGEVSAPPADIVSGEPVPNDTRLDVTFTARALGVEPPDLSTMLGRLQAEVESSWSLA
ncbi:MAG TPA: hypothetical protein VEF89_23735 [Solirubrobacteraceae bacterium]|nr:hypothetical protein [Solirubrobacteraceae bacterium]